ncbi:hypothetical protein P280DRAFT_484540 [Massarina eburnea CBS 473.64]|uniref:Uncharacterized protein n=1 Tax=Massarina eburnea CBS 473.64 TaxID=1395130 RepID=A0A6A6RN40_9PLEO|nr:hypothetical protein P280DRAFT_484540 [Massarina eburnea CBS 473.64]
MVEASPPATETIADDDTCPVCHLLIYAPVRTQCSHILCASCMAQWADTTSTTNIIHSSLDLDLREFDPNYDPAYDLEASCPMCRTQTSAQPDTELSRELEERYPKTYQGRKEEEEVDRGQRSGQGGVEGVMILIGNRHRLERGSGDDNQHDWTFFVRLSRPDLVEHVHVNLHPTFRPPRVTLSKAPFEVRRLGWGTFTLQAVIVLKNPYVWVQSVEEDEKENELKLQWTLDFEGRGRQGRVRAKVIKEEGTEELDGIARRTRSGGVRREEERRSPVRYPHMDPEFET